MEGKVESKQSVEYPQGVISIQRTNHLPLQLGPRAHPFLQHYFVSCFLPLSLALWVPVLIVIVAPTKLLKAVVTSHIKLTGRQGSIYLDWLIGSMN